MRQTKPERSKKDTELRRFKRGYMQIDPTRCHVLQATIGLRTGAKSRKPSGGGWTFIPDTETTEKKS